MNGGFTQLSTVVSVCNNVLLHVHISLGFILHQLFPKSSILTSKMETLLSLSLCLLSSSLIVFFLRFCCGSLYILKSLKRLHVLFAHCKSPAIIRLWNTQKTNRSRVASSLPYLSSWLILLSFSWTRGSRAGRFLRAVLVTELTPCVASPSGNVSLTATAASPFRFWRSWICAPLHMRTYGTCARTRHVHLFSRQSERVSNAAV